MLIILFSVFNFLFIPSGRLSWLPVSFLLHVKYTLLHSIVRLHVQLKSCTNLLQLESGGGERYDKLYGEQSLCVTTIREN